MHILRRNDLGYGYVGAGEIRPPFERGMSFGVPLSNQGNLPGGIDSPALVTPYPDYTVRDNDNWVVQIFGDVRQMIQDDGSSREICTPAQIVFDYPKFFTRLVRRLVHREPRIRVTINPYTRDFDPKPKPRIH